VDDSEPFEEFSVNTSKPGLAEWTGTAVIWQQRIQGVDTIITHGDQTSVSQILDGKGHMGQTR
jgi:hypothetical protein